MQTTVINKRWLVKEQPNVSEVAHLQQSLNVPEIVASMLVQRGISTFEKAKSFFRPDLKALHDPFLMKDMDRAVERLEIALANDEKILVYGDYDVDGTTAVTMMFEVLRLHFNHIKYYIPDRYKEGYGLSKQGVDYAKENDFTLVIALDCGIKAIDNVAYAKENNIDFIICDHHTPGDALPEAIVLDPKRKDCQYPYKELSGCGVGFKLLSAFYSKMNWEPAPLKRVLDLLAISIAADIVPITGENRILAYFGLEALNRVPRLGIQYLLKLAQKPLPLNLTNVVFVIAPRINAAGRMGDAKDAVALLLSKNNELASQLAENIHQANDERKKIDETITDEALNQILEDKSNELKVSNVVFHPSWHKGVIGIVASRIIESIYKPTVVLTQPDLGGKITGSVRSIKGVNVYEVLEECKDALIQFGGHYYAAGLTLAPEQLDLFKLKFDEAVRKRVNHETLIPEQILEKELAFNEIFESGESILTVPRIKRILKQFEPHGPGNMKPVFTAKNVFAVNARLLKEKHIKMSLEQPGHDPVIEAIMFNRPDLFELVSSEAPMDIVFTLEENEWQTKKTLQLNIKDLRSSL